MSLLGLKSGYKVKYSLSPQKIHHDSPSWFPSGSRYISPYNPPLVTIQIQEVLSLGTGINFTEDGCTMGIILSLTIDHQYMMLNRIQLTQMLAQTKYEVRERAVYLIGVNIDIWLPV